MDFSDLTPGSRIHGLAGESGVEIILVEPHGDNVSYRHLARLPMVFWHLASCYAEDLDGLKVEVAGRNWTFDADADEFLLASRGKQALDGTPLRPVASR